MRGRVRSADDRTVTVDLEDGGERTVAIADIERARTVFTWGGNDKPGKKKTAPSKESR